MPRILLHCNSKRFSSGFALQAALESDPFNSVQRYFIATSVIKFGCAWAFMFGDLLCTLQLLLPIRYAVMSVARNVWHPILFATPATPTAFN